MKRFPQLVSRSTRSSSVVAIGLIAGVILAAQPAGAGPLDDLPNLPPPIAAGSFSASEVAPIASTAKQIDGFVSDWVGERSGFAGALHHAAGELVYEDYVFDAYGADDGKDSARYNAIHPIVEAAPPAYRMQDMSWFLPRWATGSDGLQYGDARSPDGLRESADLVELRVAADAEALYVLGRVGQMRTTEETALLLLFGPEETGDTARSVPFNAGISSSFATVAVLLGSNGGRVVDLVTGSSEALPDGSVASRPDGFVNAVEARIPRALVSDQFRLAAATGYLDRDTGDLMPVGPGEPPVNLVNVAFRREPVSLFMDMSQAMALRERSIDSFSTVVDVEDLVSGRTQELAPSQGYFERVFESTAPGQSTEEEPQQGAFQQYGLYIPSAYRSDHPNPVTFYFKFGGGTTHMLASWLPRFVREFGEDRGNIMVFPNGRARFNMYVGVGYTDFLEVLADVERFGRDHDRTYATGYSMGGYATFLLSALHPDLFAAIFPADVFPLGRTWRELLMNSAGIPQVWYASVNGDADMRPTYEKVRAWGAERYGESRYYNFSPTSNHYSLALADEWAEAAAYLGNRRRVENPEHVRFRRVPAIERAIARGDHGLQTEGVTVPPARPTSVPVTADSAFWVSDVAVREGDAESLSTFAEVDAWTHGLGHKKRVARAEFGVGPSPGQTSPYRMDGVAYDETTDPPVPPRNAFEAVLTNVERVRLDTTRMGLDSASSIEGTIRSDGSATLVLAGLRDGLSIWLNGTRVGSVEGADAVIQLDRGTNKLLVVPEDGG